MKKRVKTGKKEVKSSAKARVKPEGWFHARQSLGASEPRRERVKNKIRLVRQADFVFYAGIVRMYFLFKNQPAAGYQPPTRPDFEEIEPFRQAVSVQRSLIRGCADLLYLFPLNVK